MFSALRQGSLVYILDKTDGLKFKIGEVVSMSAPHTNYTSSFNQQNCIDLKISVDGTTCDYNSIPSSCSIVTYNNNKLTLSETKQGLQSEVEAILQNAKQILDNVEIYKKNIQSCESILKELNPQFAKDKERDERLDNLENKLDNILNLLKQ